MTTIKLKPAPGCRVRYPDNPTLLLSVEGDQVTLTSAWRRLIKAGDVLEVVDPPPPEALAASTARATKRTEGGE